MGRNLQIGVGVLVLLAVLSACQGEQPRTQPQEEAGAALRIESDAFDAEETIPQRYTCDGEDLSPALSWSDPPPGTQGLVLIGDDPDAPVGTWDHWVLFNIPATTRALPEGIPDDPVIDGVGTHGSNGWHRLGYSGPCPPKGGTHRYHFKLYALDTTLNLDPGASKKDVETAMEGHILAEGQLMGLYGR